MQLPTWITMPKLSILAGVIFISFLASGCGASHEPDVLRVGNGAEVQELDPHLVSGVTEHRVLTALFEGICDVDPATNEPIPGVAASWDISDDGLLYTFHLRNNARWSNGDLVTAHDFVYSWRRILSPALASEYAYLLHCIENAEAFNSGEISDFADVGVRALDELTLEVRLDHPTPYFLTMQTHFAWFPVHRGTIERFGTIDERGTGWTRAGNMVSNGAFKLTAWRPNEIIRVNRNTYYWNYDAVGLTGIAYYPIDNLQTEERSFRSGELHMTNDIPLHRIDVYRRDNPELLHIHPYLGVYFYRFNVTRRPFDDIRVRQAFSLAIDRETLTRNVLQGNEEPAWFFVPPATAGYTSTSRVAYDPERARTLLAEAGYPGGSGLPVVEILYNTHESHKTIAEAIQRMWREHLGADVRLLNQDWRVYLSSMSNLDFDIARSAWIGDVDDPINFLECFLTDGGNNRTGFASAEFDSYVRRAYAESHQQTRLQYLQKAEEILLEEAPIAPIYFYTRKFLMDPAVQGYVPNHMGYIRWQELSLAE